MFKALIVDDEPVIRKGLKNVINWDSLECSVCGEASDGIEGMRMIRENMPDIVISDIRMPGINGLQMIKETREIVPDCKIIILTGFRDFEYLQEAIKLGAFEYMLKPAKIQDITMIIRRAVEDIKKRIRKEEELKSLKSKFESKIPELRQKLLYDVMYKITCKEEEIQELMEMYDIQIDKFLLMVVEIDEIEEDAGRSQIERQLYQFGIINSFEEGFSENYRIYNVPLNNRMMIFIIQPMVLQDDFTQDVYSKIMAIKDSINNCCFDITITIAVSSQGGSVMDLPCRLKEAMEAIEYKFYMGSDSVILFEDIKSFYRGTDFSMLESLQKLLLQSIRTGNEENTKNIVGEIQDCINEHSMDTESIKSFYLNLFSAINTIPVPGRSKEEHGNGKVQMPIIYNTVEGCRTINDLSSLLEHFSVAAASKVNSFNHKTINSTLQRAMEYINIHYPESITLNDVAEYTYVSTFYLSRMFTKELGKNFVDYLNEMRIEKAKELLKTVGFKTYEVAEMVGVRDAHYFSKLFKKYTGVTPSEYKSSNMTEKSTAF